MELAHCLIGIAAGADEGVVAFFELFFFLIVIGKRLCDADAGDAGLKGCVDLCNRLAASLERVAHFLSEEIGYHEKEGNCHEYDQGQPDVDS